MSEVTTGARSVLSLAGVYDLVQHALGASRYRREIARTYVRGRAASRLRVLDVGCGTARILEYLPDCDYVGIDVSARYIDAARRRFGDRGTFVQAGTTRASFDRWRGHVDCLIMLGFLHHVDDQPVVELLKAAAPALAAEGRLVAVDPTVAANTPAAARWLASHDRGQHVRAPDGYADLARQAFEDVRLHVRHDLLRVPYSHAILECSRPRGRS